MRSGLVYSAHIVIRQDPGGGASRGAGGVIQTVDCLAVGGGVVRFHLHVEGKRLAEAFGRSKQGDSIVRDEDFSHRTARSMPQHASNDALT